MHLECLSSFFTYDKLLERMAAQHDYNRRRFKKKNWRKNLIVLYITYFSGITHGILKNRLACIAACADACVSFPPAVTAHPSLLVLAAPKSIRKLSIMWVASHP